VALVEFGGEVTNVSVYAAGMLLGLVTIPMGSGDITDAIASAFGIRRFQAERLKCVHGSAIASPADHREMIPVNAPGEGRPAPVARHADDKNRIPRAELVSVITTAAGPVDGRGVQGAEGAGLYRPARPAGGADRRRRGAGRPGRLCAGALGKPVRIGKFAALKGLAEAHAKPGFATLAGLVLYAAADPIDIRAIGPVSARPRYKGIWRWSIGLSGTA
jgi:cell division protein FtsA